MTFIANTARRQKQRAGGELWMDFVSPAKRRHR